MTRDAARDRVLTTLRFFWTAPQGAAGAAASPAITGSSITSSTWRPGCRFEPVELSTIDTALLLAGALICRQYFDGDDADDASPRARRFDLRARRLAVGARRAPRS